MRSVTLEYGRLRVSDDPTGLIGYLLEFVRGRDGGTPPQVMFAPTGIGLFIHDQIGALREGPDRWRIARWGVSSNAVTIAGDDLRGSFAAAAMLAYSGGPPRDLAPFPVGATTRGGHYRATNSIAGSPHAGIYGGVNVGTRAPVRITIGAPQTRAHSELSRALAFDVGGIAPLLHVGALDVTFCGEAFDVLVEAEPEGVPATADQLDPRVAVQLVLDVARVVQRAHGAGVAIGVLRPEVIYVDSERRLTGLAPRAERFLATRTRMDVDIPCFKELFAAPEVLNGGPPTPASDVFALATLATRWLTGTPAFAGPYPIVITTTRNAYTGPPALAEPLARALAIDAADRISIAQLLDAFEVS